jgi:hypothetical protein
MMMMNMTVSGAREGHHRRENIQTFNHPSSRGSRQVVTSYIVMLGLRNGIAESYKMTVRRTRDWGGSSAGNRNSPERDASQYFCTKVPT